MKLSLDNSKTIRRIDKASGWRTYVPAWSAQAAIRNQSKDAAADLAALDAGQTVETPLAVYVKETAKVNV